MQLTLWTYEGPPHIGAMRIATAMDGVHYVLHAPQGDTYADLLFTMIERRNKRPPVTYTTFQARDLGGDTAELFKTAARDAYERFKPQAMLVGASCTAELIQDDPGGLAQALALPIPVVPLELPAYQKKENWGASETFYQLVRALAGPGAPAPGTKRPARAEGVRARCNLLGATALGFRHRDDVAEITRLLGRLGVDVAVCAPMGATPTDLARLGEADFNIVLYPEVALSAADWLRRTYGQPMIKTVPIGVGATRAFIAEVAALAGVDATEVLADATSRLPWYSRSVDSTYLTGKRVFIFGDATHALAAAKIASQELGFEVVGLGTYSREFARDIREAAKGYGIEALISDDYLEVEAAIAALHPELVLGTQMERHIAKRLGVPCAVISAPVHVQDFPARYSPQMGFEGANVIFDTWVHPLMMGLEEHLLGMFREDQEFNDHAPSHLGHGHKSTAPADRGVASDETHEAPQTNADLDAGGDALVAVASKTQAHAQAQDQAAPAPVDVVWSKEGEKELGKIPFFVRGKARRNTERYASDHHIAVITVETLYDAKAVTAAETPIRVVIVTMDNHLTGALERARPGLERDMPGLVIAMHTAAEWCADEDVLARCKADIAKADIIVAGMLFLEDHFLPIIDDLKARRDNCDALVCAASAKEIVSLTRIGKFTMDGTAKGGALEFLKKLRGKPDPKKNGTPGAQQMAMLKRLPQILRFIPGTAQDVRAYFLTLQYWMGGSDVNIGNMVRHLVGRYADGPRKALRAVKAAAPIDYPDVGVYHPSLVGRVSDKVEALPRRGQGGTVGVLVMRSYLLAGNTEHYDGVIAALEARGLNVVPVYASGLDMRPAIDKFLKRDGVPVIDALVSLTGFSLVGGPAYNDAHAAEEALAALDVPYLAAHPVEFQTLETWGNSDRGLMPVESTIMVAIPELDGASGPMVFGGRSDAGGVTCTGCHRGCTFKANTLDRNMHTCVERAEMLASRVAKLVALRRAERAARKIAIVLFNFPPNAGNIGTAAYLSVFQSLHNMLRGMQGAGYTVDVPESVDALREAVLHGNAQRFGADANVVHRIKTDEHVARERYLAEIEAQWGPAPGRQQTDGATIHVLGEQFGNVMVAVQPSIGYEGDPMRLLFEHGFAPTHAFSAFYRYLREDFAAHAVLHFGTHGALEFMPGKQTGLSADCWPDRLIGDLPNIYLYASNNPSEGAIAKRRSAATLVSYMTPPVSNAGLYRGLQEIKGTIDQWRRLTPEAPVTEREQVAALIQAQAVTCNLVAAEPVWTADAHAEIAKLGASVLELEYTLIPHGLHVVGEGMAADERAASLKVVAETAYSLALSDEAIAILADGGTPQAAHAASGLENSAEIAEKFTKLAVVNSQLVEDTEIGGLLRALDARFIRPAPGGDLLRTPEILPTGRNIHGFDPFRIPSAYAVQDGARQAQKLIERHLLDGNPLPETIALVLWGSDNLKSEGAPLAQALALLGAEPRFDSYGRLAGAQLIPLATLGRPRIDVMVTLSGIFRDLLPLQIKLLAEATYIAATADEPLEHNFIRKHALAYVAEHGGDIETAALRVFGNADGAYGANVGNLLESGRWEDEDELAETYTQRKGFAFGRKGIAVDAKPLLQSVLAGVDLAYQNLDSVELGVTTVDTYFDTLGGISRAVRRAKGGTAAPVYIGDQTRGEGQVRTLGEQVALETRTRTLNPKWYEGMLKHGYEGVRQIEVHVTNTMGWSATTGEVQPWVYQQLSETFVLDPAMRDRLAKLNPTASARVANRLMEAHDRGYWSPDAETLAALKGAQEELEDRLEGIEPGASRMEIAA